MKVEIIKSVNLPIKDIEVNKGQIEGLPKNPRLIKNERFEKLKKSIEDNPEMLGAREVLVYPLGSKYVVIGGNMRFQACKDLGFITVPCKVLDKDMTAEQLRAITIKDNVSFGELDFDALANEWEAEELEEWGLELPNVLEDETILEAEEDDFDATLPSIAVTVLGDLYEIGEHRLLCGDSTDSDSVEKLMNGEKADMVFTDPPYGINAIKSSGVLSKRYEQYQNEESDKTALDFINMCIANFDKIICWGGNYFAHNLPKSTHWIIWDKRGAEMQGGNKNGDQSDCEIAWTNLQKKNVKIYKHVWAGWFRQGSKELELTTKIHPSQKPVGLFIDIFNDYDFNSCFDGFLGSGSTMVAAHQLKRKCFGMELEPKYCDVIVKRMLTLDPNLVVKRNGQPIDKNQYL